nr:VWA domain-containing protein [Acidobacteriota bacterium]
MPDASRITPPVTPQGTRAGHDISLEVTLDAGVPIDDLRSRTHEIDVVKANDHSARVRLKNMSEIPNKDFVLRYDVAGGKIADAVLTHRAQRGGFFTLILQPPDRVTAEDVTPKEIVFVLDTSGSMMGFPIEKAKEAMQLAFDGLYPQDTFNLITFAGDTHILFPQPVPATRENLRKAQGFLASREGSGGTEMMKAIRAALEPSDKQDHIRIVCFMTDGYVGNDMEIISEVQKHPNARVFSFGIGSSVNRFLLDKMSEYGRGEVEYVALDDDGSAAARRFHERVRSPLLTDISIEWGGLPVADVYPKRIPDLFSAKPVILSGRYTGTGSATIKLKGKMSGRDTVRE